MIGWVYRFISHQGMYQSNLVPWREDRALLGSNPSALQFAYRVCAHGSIDTFHGRRLEILYPGVVNALNPKKWGREAKFTQFSEK